MRILTHALKLLIPALLVLAMLAPFPVSGQGDEPVSVKILRVIDGDTVEISGGERVRLLGIDAPEKAAPFSRMASDRLIELTASEDAILYACEDRDVYGRILATIRVGRVNVNHALLLEGLALPMLIPPCGRPVTEEIIKAAGMGALSGRGIYSLKEYGIISHLEAADRIDERAIVRGRIVELHKGRKAWHLNFGPDWKTDFTAVLFRDAQRMFSELGIDPAHLVGSEVLVIGKIKSYNGPEIIVRGPDQIIPISEIHDP